ASVNAFGESSVVAQGNPPVTVGANEFELSVQLAGGGSGAVSSSPAGIDCGTQCTAEFAQDTQVTLTAAPATGSTFAGWSGACDGVSATCVVTMAQDSQATATF